jgi:1-phosphofructokinase family hexose kinase
VVIVAAGLSPAWQQILSFDSLRWGEVNRARTAHWCASGKVLNVGIAIAHLRAQSLTIAPLGGLGGQAIADEFAHLKLPARWIEVAAPTRVCTTLLEADGPRTTELVENAGVMTIDELVHFEAAYLEAVASAQAVVLTGSIPPGAGPDLFRRLLEQTPTPAILDIRGPELTASLHCRPLVVKPNREELGHTVGKVLESDADLHAAMHALNERGAQWVVVSQGRHAVWATSGGQLYRFQPPTVQVVNAIGSGDCLAAGIAWQIAEGREPLDAIRVGIAAASLNATMLLPGRLDPAEALALAETINVEQA